MKLKKPIAGVMPLWDDEKDSIWMLPGYLDGINQAGAIPLIFPFSIDEEELSQLTELCDGFLFTGGHDVSPRLYHEQPMEGIISCCEKRDQMETIVLKKATKFYVCSHSRGLYLFSLEQCCIQRERQSCRNCSLCY